MAYQTLLPTFFPLFHLFFLQGEKSKDAPSWDPIGLKFLEQKAPRDSHCHLSSSPRAIEHAYQYGGTANSRQEFEHEQGDFGEK